MEPWAWRLAARPSYWPGTTSWRGSRGVPRWPQFIPFATTVSHAHVILENFLAPLLFNGKILQPPVEIVSVYADQMAKDRPDLTESMVRQFKLRRFNTIAEALTLGGKELAVDAVLSIGEHGDYPTSKLGVREYPRKRFFDEIVAVMRRSNRFVPIFNDKHLSYRWDWARDVLDNLSEAPHSVHGGKFRPAVATPAGAGAARPVRRRGSGQHPRRAV